MLGAGLARPRWLPRRKKGAGEGRQAPEPGRDAGADCLSEPQEDTALFGTLPTPVTPALSF